MENVMKTMTGLLKSEIDSSCFTACAAFTDNELLSLYELSKHHDLAALVCDALDRAHILPDNAVGEKFRKERLIAMLHTAKLEYEIPRITAVLERAQIPYIPLKGAVIRPLYPEPWMRNSCDMDIFVRETDLMSAAAAVERELGYRTDGKKGPHDLLCVSPDGLHLELHYTLIEDSAAGAMADKPLAGIENFMIPTDTPYHFRLSEDMFYYYHIAHMAKHFLHGGCGIKPFLDLKIMRENRERDNAATEKLLAAGGLSAFAKTAEELSRVWFGTAEHSDLTRRMEAYVLEGGVYGTTKMRVAVQQARKGGKFRYILSRLWLPYDALKFKYPSLEKHKWLLPLYELRRCFGLIFGGGARRSLREFRINNRIDASETCDMNDLLSRLGLDK